MPGPTAFAGRSWFHGWLVATAWERDELAPTLPPELELAPAGSDPHPVIVFLGEQTGTSLLRGGIPVPTGTSFRELGFAVPFVRLRREPTLHIYVPRIYASYFPTVWVGSEVYGLGKLLGRLWWQGDVFLVTGEDGRLAVHAEVEPSGPWTAGSAGHLPAFDALARLLTTAPVLGRRPGGGWVRSRFAWDPGDARVRAGGACVSVEADALPGVPPRRCPGVPGGCVEVRGLVWDIGWPEPGGR